MIIYVDENVAQKVTMRLREEGYKVEYVTRSVVPWMKSIIVRHYPASDNIYDNFRIIA